MKGLYSSESDKWKTTTVVEWLEPRGVRSVIGGCQTLSIALSGKYVPGQINKVFPSMNEQGQLAMDGNWENEGGVIAMNPGMMNDTNMVNMNMANMGMDGMDGATVEWPENSWTWNSMHLWNNARHSSDLCS